MDNLEFRRRVISQWNINPDDYQGFDFGYSGKSTKSYAFKSALSPFFPLTGGSQVTLYCSTGSYRLCLITYNSAKEENDYWSYSGSQRTFAVKSTAVWGRLFCNLDDMANYWIKDANGNYLFNGADYV